MDITKIRSLFPITKEATYLNSASQATLNTCVQNKLEAYLKSEITFEGKKGFNRDDVRIPLANLLGGSSEEYALSTSTGVGLGMIAQGIYFKKGDNIIIPEKEHWNNAFPWLHLEKKGIEVRFAKLNKDNSLNPKAIERLIDNKTRFVAVAAVRFNSGFRPNLGEISKIAHAENALFVVDAAQGAGMVPIDVVKDGIDIMAGCGFKWLLSIGIDTVYKKALENTALIINGLLKNNYNLVTPIKNDHERTAIVHFNANSFTTTKTLFKKLKQHKLMVTLQGENIRVSPNFFTTKKEIEVFLSLL